MSEPDHLKQKSSNGDENIATPYSNDPSHMTDTEIKSETVDKMSEHKDINISSMDSHENKPESEASIPTSGEMTKDDRPSSSIEKKLYESQLETKDGISQDSISSDKEDSVSEVNESSEIFKQPNQKAAVSECSEKEDLPCSLDYKITPDINELCLLIDTEIKSEIVDQINEHMNTNISSIDSQENQSDTSLPNVMEGSSSKAFKRPLSNQQSLDTAKRRKLFLKSRYRQTLRYGEKGDICLCLSHLPCSWNDADIKKLIEDLEKECETVKSHEILEDVSSNNENRVLLLRFETPHKSHNAMKFFNTKMIAEGSDIQVFRGKEELFREEHKKATGAKSSDSERETNDSENQQVNMQEANQEVTKIMDIWDDDPFGLYGLSLGFLKRHNIRLPLTNWVHARNFQMEKSQLKEIMEMAGNVTFCHVVRTKTGYAKVKFSHPIEAAQAVSMFNGQMMHGRILSVCIDPNPHNSDLLPPGVAKIGPGFGPEGSPMRDIVKQLERHMDGKKTEINCEIFGKKANEPKISTDETKRILVLIRELVDMGIKTKFVIEHLKALKANTTVKNGKKSTAEKQNSTKVTLSQGVDKNAFTNKDVVKSVTITEKETTVTKSTVKTTSSNDTATLQMPSEPANKTPSPKTSPNAKLKVAQNYTKNVTKSGPVSPPANSSSPVWINNNAVNNKKASKNNFGPTKNTFQRSPIIENANFGPGNSSPSFGPNVQNNGPFNGSRSFGPSGVPGPFRFVPGIPINMGSSGPCGPHVSSNGPFGTPGPNPTGSGPWGNIGTFGPIAMGPGPNFMGPRMGPGHNVMGSGPNVMGPGSNVMGPGSNAMGPGPNAMGPGPNAMGPGPNAMGPGPNAMGPGPNAMRPGPNAMRPGQSHVETGQNDMLMKMIVSISNLPPSVTHALLHEKMSECGKVNNITMTKTGYAIIRYTNEWEADRCINTYNNTVVDGNRIEVKRCLS